MREKIKNCGISGMSCLVFAILGMIISLTAIVISIINVFNGNYTLKVTDWLFVIGLIIMIFIPLAIMKISPKKN